MSVAAALSGARLGCAARPRELVERPRAGPSPSAAPHASALCSSSGRPAQALRVGRAAPASQAVASRLHRGLACRAAAAQAQPQPADALSPADQVTEFMVEMSCGKCEAAVRAALAPLPGVLAVSVDLDNQLVAVTGGAAVAQLLAALAGTGRAAKLIGQGSTVAFDASLEESLAAVAEFKGPVVFGLLRVNQLSDQLARAEGAFDGLAPGPHRLAVHMYGNLTGGIHSTGGPYVPDAGGEPLGDLGVITADASGHAELPSRALDPRVKVWDVIGRGLVIAAGPEPTAPAMAAGRAGVAAVVARAARAGQNRKKLCTCDGVVIWQAKPDQAA